MNFYVHESLSKSGGLNYTYMLNLHLFRGK